MTVEKAHDACFSCSMVSFVGKGFFSSVSVFFSLDLSKLVTSAKFGLSPIVAESKFGLVGGRSLVYALQQ